MDIERATASQSGGNVLNATISIPMRVAAPPTAGLLLAAPTFAATLSTTRSFSGSGLERDAFAAAQRIPLQPCLVAGSKRCRRFRLNASRSNLRPGDGLPTRHRPGRRPPADAARRPSWGPDISGFDTNLGRLNQASLTVSAVSALMFKDEIALYGAPGVTNTALYVTGGGPDGSSGFSIPCRFDIPVAKESHGASIAPIPR